MNPRRDQLDLFAERERLQRLARAYRAAAETARVDPFHTPAQRERRAAHYEAEAQRIEARA